MALAGTACHEASAPLPLPREAIAIAPNGSAAASADPYSRANIVWHDLVNVGSAASPEWVPAGIRGDGRNRFGQPAAPLNEYQGDFCGVRTVIYDYKRPFGGISFDTDIYYDAATMSGPCGSRRTVDFYLGAAPTTSSPHVLVGDLWNLAPGEVRLMNVTFGQELPCSTLQFDAQFSGASSARVTRLPDVSAVRQWRVESQGNHQAACMKQLKSDRQADTGLRYYLPFSIIITQVPAPSASYP